MKLALATHSPEITVPPPVALLSGSFAERLAKAKRLGYDGVELMVARPHELDAVQLRAQLVEAGLEVCAVASGPIFMVDGLTLLARTDELSRQAETRLTGLINLAAALGAPLVTIGSFRGRLAWAGGETARERLLKLLKSAAEVGAGRGVRLALEPLNRYETDVIRDAAEGLAFIAEAGHNHLGLLLDTFHINIEEASVTDCFRSSMAAGRLWHVHLGDSNRQSPGKGHLDFPGIVQTLGEIGYTGWLSAELLPLPDPDTAAAATIGHIRPMIPRAPAQPRVTSGPWPGVR
jgi:sugar phosphate isomerase/epimerase